MQLRAGVALCSLLFTVSQVITLEAADDIYFGQIMIEGNVTMNISSYLPNLTSIDLENGVTIEEVKIVTECDILGEDATCWCAGDFIWSQSFSSGNPECNNKPTCGASTHAVGNSAICVRKKTVRLNGTLTTSDILVHTDANVQNTLLSKFEVLNGYNWLNYTGYRGGTTTADFEVDLSTPTTTAKLLSIIAELESIFGGEIYIQTEGIAVMEAPLGKVCYQSKQIMNCSIEESMESCVWQKSNQNIASVIGPGSETRIAPTCTTETHVELLNVTGLWAGNYMCQFISGKVTHAAFAELKVALLPDEIIIQRDPQCPDCTFGGFVNVSITCTVLNSTEKFIVKFDMGNTSIAHIRQETGNFVIYNATGTIDCKSTTPTVLGSCNFKNTINQTKGASIIIPVLNPGGQFCKAEGVWPKSPPGALVSAECEIGRVGEIQRKCLGNTWGQPVSLCVKEELKELSGKATQFGKGLGATEEGAVAIFSLLKNNTEAGNEPTYGDSKTSVNVLSSMHGASTLFEMGENLMPDFIESASNVMNTSWDSGEAEQDEGLAVTYLQSVEGLIKNMKINTTTGHNATNVQLQVCMDGPPCNSSVYGVDMELNSSAGVVKTLGLQNLAERLPKDNYSDSIVQSIVLSVTVQNATDTDVNIKLGFPLKDDVEEKDMLYCVYWNTTKNTWSSDGCNWTVNGNLSFCECNHLTSFAVLMSKHPIDLPMSNELTYICLGISICSLLVYIAIELLVWNAVAKSSLGFFRHMALINISLNLLLAYCCFLASSFRDILSDTMCLVLTVAKHFFFMAMFFWMLCLSVMLVHKLIFVFSQLSKKVYLTISLLIGYLCPIITVAITYGYYKGTDQSYHNDATCWLNYDGPMQGSIHAFLFPVGVIVLINIFSMVVVLLTLLKPSAVETGKKDDKEAVKSILKVIVFLTPVFGGTWILGFMVFSAEGDSFFAVMINYAFIIVNALQGFFILLTGVFGEKRVRDEVLKHIMAGLNSGKTPTSESTTISKTSVKKK